MVEKCYGGKRIPEDEFFLNTLTREFAIPRERVETFAKIFIDNLKFLRAFSPTGVKQKPIVYFDENVPAAFVDHFRQGSWWKKKIKVMSAVDLGNQGQSDDFHFRYCAKSGYTLVSFDTDFNDDTAFTVTVHETLLELRHRNPAFAPSCSATAARPCGPS